MSPPVASSLANRLLVALPALHDPNFARSVTLLCQHDGDGAMGVVVNRVSEYTLGEVFRQMGIASDDEALQARAVLAGGPVHPERGFVIHDGDGEWDSSLEIGDGLRLTTSRDVLEAMSSGGGPRRVLVTLGYSSWGEGQLESEIARNSWLTVDADANLVFDAPVDQRYDQALRLLGLESWMLSPDIGHA